MRYGNVELHNIRAVSTLEDRAGVRLRRVPEHRCVVVGGDSAGGNLALATALLMRDAGLGPLAGMLLIYPVTDHYTPGMPSSTTYAEGDGLTRDAMTWFWNQYLRDPTAAGHPRPHPCALPTCAVYRRHSCSSLNVTCSMTRGSALRGVWRRQAC